MPSAPLPPHEARRLAVLHELGLLDSEPEGTFDAVVQAAARLTGCPIALISLVDRDRQWFKAAHGIAVSETPREVSFCAHAILGDSLLEVPDTHHDPRFADSPLVCGDPRIRFYAGQPLQFRGAMVGTLCVVDMVPRRLSDEQREALAGLSRIATELLRSRQRMNALHAEQRRLLDFGRASGDWMWECDARMRCTWVSEEFASATGISCESVIGTPVPDGPLLDALGMTRGNRGTLGELLARRQAFSRAVIERHTPRGSLFVSRSAVPVLDEAGRFAGYRGTARDITSQIEAARRSRGRHMLLRKLSSQLPGVIFQFRLGADGSASYPYASEGLRELFAFDGPLEELRGDAAQPLRALHPDDRPGFVDSIMESARTLRPWQREYRIVRGDGSVRWLETRSTPERLPDGATLWHGFTADVTERKQTELALRRSEERWAMAADAAGIGIAEVDLATGRMTLDRRGCDNHGLPYPQPDYTFADWLQSLHPDDRDGASASLQRALAERSTLERRCRAVHPDGRVVTLEITARGRYDAQGEPVGMVGTCRDVTEQMAIERLQRDKEAAERANRAKSEFLSRVSHELRTPLNGILGFAQLMSLDRAAPLAPEQQRRLTSVARAGRHLLGLINDVLDLTRIESEDFSLRTASVDVWHAVGECLALIQPLADEAGVRLPAAPAHLPCWVQADPRALEQVLMNLLSNAIKYNRRGGHVEIDVQRRADADAPDGVVEIAVRDNGRGIAEAKQALLFQPFNRLGAEHTRTEGSGLGLVIAQELAQAMGGRLTVASRAGSGSTFTLALPPGRGRPAAAPPAPAAPAVRPAAPAVSRCVLYIEDEPLNRVLMEELIRTEPRWRLVVAHDGASGERIARESAPDLVLIDINLPDISGIELIRSLRRHPQTRALRCIALSADAMREQIDAALAAGFDDYWTKPIDVPRVLADLARLLAPASQPAAASG